MKKYSLPLVLLLIIGGLWLWGERSAEAPAPLEEPTNIVAETYTVTITIEGVLSEQPVTLREPTTVLELLKQLNDTDERLELRTETYPEMGVLVTALGGQENGSDGRYWLYEVNGELPLLGVDQLRLQPDDVVSWRFIEPEI